MELSPKFFQPEGQKSYLFWDQAFLCKNIILMTPTQASTFFVLSKSKSDSAKAM